MKKFIIVGFFLIVSFFVLSGIIFNDQLIGRSLDFSVPPVSGLLKNAYIIDFYQWSGTVNGGGRTTFSPTLIPVNFILYFPAFFNLSSWFVARYQLILTLFLAMFFFYIFAQRLLESHNLKKEYKNLISINGAIFFTFNNYFFNDLIFGSTVMYLTFAFIPLFAYAIVSYEKTKGYFYFLLTLLSLVVISSTLQHLVMAYVILAIFAIFIHKDYKFFVKIGLLHLFLSFYWVLPMLSTTAEIRGAELISDPTAALTVSSASFLSGLLNKDYFYSRNHYLLALSNVYLAYAWIFNAVILLLLSLYSVTKIRYFKKEQKKIIIGFALLFLASVLFIKGGREPFGSSIIFLYKTIPIFTLFRSIQHYIGFYVMSISILFVFSSVYLVKKRSFYIYIISLIVITSALPWWWTRDLGTENITKSNTIPSYHGQFYLTEGNWKMYSLNDRLLDFSILPMPPGFSINFLAVGSNNFNYISRGDFKIKTQGGDTGLAYGNKSFFATEVTSSFLGKTLDDLEKEMYSNENFFRDYKNLFALLNVKYFILREDVAPLFSKNSSAFNLKNIKTAISNSDIFKSVATTDFVTILENKNFLPKIYIPKLNIDTSYPADKIAEIVSGSGYQINSAIFFRSQNENKYDVLNRLNGNTEGNQVVEYKKIDPTKYRIRIHGASGQFPLVFGENFHERWEAYVVSVKSGSAGIPQGAELFNGVTNYKILDGNEGDQASKDELINYIDKRWVSYLGNGKVKEIIHYKWDASAGSGQGMEKFDHVEKYNIDFISKNFQGTIQNNNLPSGSFYESWFENRLSEDSHLTANGYANSWIIETEKICNDNLGKCIINPDGTYDLELILEFWPQRLFYVGSAVSGITLVFCLMYLVFNYKRNRKINKLKLKNDKVNN